MRVIATAGDSPFGRDRLIAVLPEWGGFEVCDGQVKRRKYGHDIEPVRKIQPMRRRAPRWKGAPQACACKMITPVELIGIVL